MAALLRGPAGLHLGSGRCQLSLRFDQADGEEGIAARGGRGGWFSATRQGRAATRCSGRSEAMGVRCVVVAPSLIPVKPGQRIKTDRRDARKLVELFKAGLLTEVRPPTVERRRQCETSSRCREDVLEDLARCRHRLGKLLLRRGYPLFGPGEEGNWTLSHRRWMRGRSAGSRKRIGWSSSDYLLAVHQVAEPTAGPRRSQLGGLRTGREPYFPWPVGALGPFRGISTVTAMTIVAELHGIGRFTRPRQLMAYLGMSPAEHSSS